MDLTCYVYEGWRPRIRAASSRRQWMDETPDSFAYRCLPLNIANAHGWEVLSPCGFEAEWNGGPAVEDVVVRLDPGAPTGQAPVALFGQGVLTFHLEGLFRTSPGFSLWVGGPPNAAKDGIAALDGVIETDWSPYSFTMNWRFTRPGHVIRFEENEPFCFLFPVERSLLETIRPTIAPIEGAPELKRQFEIWSASRDRFQASVAAEPPASSADAWQKAYYRGVDADGAPGPDDHRSKLRLAEFEGAEAFHQGPPSPRSCPVAHAPTARADPDGAPAAKLAWLLGELERLRTLSPTTGVPRRNGLSAVQFRDEHYAANWPVVMPKEVVRWPAVSRWTPEYLKARIGERPVQVQTCRARDPDYERNMPAHAAEMPFVAFIDQILKDGTGNDTYLTAYNASANAEALAPLLEDLEFLGRFLTKAAHMPHGMFWIGAAGSFTPLHHDLTNNLLLQLAGRKSVLLVSPAETPRLYNDRHVYSRISDLTEPDIVGRFPLLQGLRIHEVIIEPGDVLFIPMGWWHQVRALDFSVTITHTNFRWPNDSYDRYPHEAVAT
jgi:hypothetical protein